MALPACLQVRLQEVQSLLGDELLDIFFDFGFIFYRLALRGRITPEDSIQEQVYSTNLTQPNSSFNLPVWMPVRVS